MLTEAPPELREVRGPSALGGGRRRALELLYLIAITEFRRNHLFAFFPHGATHLRPYPPPPPGVRRKVRRHQALSNLPTVRHADMEKLMDDHVILELGR